MKTIEEESKNLNWLEQNAFKKGVEFAQRWIPIEEELPEPSKDESGFGDIISKNVLVKDEYDNYDIKKYNWDLYTWMGSRSVIPKFWRPIDFK